MHFKFRTLVSSSSSSRRLSYDRSTDTFKQISLDNALWCLPFELPTPSFSLMVILQLFTSSPSSSLHLSLSFNSLFQKTVPTQDVTNPVSPPLLYCMYGIPLPLNTIQHIISRAIGPADFHPSPATHFQNFLCISDLLSEVSKFQRHKAALQMQHFTSFLPKYNSNLLVKRAFLFWKAAFCMAILDLISRVQIPSYVILLPPTVEILHIPHLLLIYHKLYRGQLP